MSAISAQIGPGHVLTATLTHEPGELGQITCSCGFVAPADDTRRLQMASNHVRTIIKGRNRP